MTAWVVLLRAINVGGTGKIEMARLRAAVEGAGFTQVRTYIASGNLVLSGPDDERDVRARLTSAIEEEFGACPDLHLRTASAIRDVEARNPYPDAAGNKVLVIFCENDPDTEGVRHLSDEQITVSGREIFIHHPSGMGPSKLVLPAAKTGTGRNMNTVAKLASMAGEIA